jgi:RNA polymerase sigma-32 factor
MVDDTYSDSGKKAVELNEDQGLPLPFDSLNTYLTEVSRHPLLTREKEREIALLMFENKDQDAARELVTANLRLVVKIALQYYNTYLNVLDLIQEGNVGILHAVKKYNPYKGTKFSSYASYWIRAYILKYIMESWSLVKVGTTQGQRKLFFSLRKETRRLEALGIYPESRLIANSLKVKEREVEEMKQRFFSTDLSLEAPLYDDSNDTIMDTLSSDEDVQEIVSRKEESELLSKKVMEFKRNLSDRAVFIFDHRIASDEPRTLQEIGSVFNISRERVRQIENKIRGKLKEYFAAEVSGLTM